jgi:hypothetical protein
MTAASSPLRLTLHAPPVRESAGPFPVIARFTNVSAEPVRMLPIFDPLPVFFTTSLQHLADGEIDVAGAGKADFPESELRPMDVSAGESLDAELDLQPWIRGMVVPGLYRLALTYHNAYGDGCFRGPLTSAPITIEVKGAP